MTKHEYLERSEVNLLMKEACSKMVDNYNIGITNFFAPMFKDHPWSNVITVDSRYLPTSRGDQDTTWTCNSGFVAAHAFIIVDLDNDVTREKRTLTFMYCPFRSIMDAKYKSDHMSFSKLEAVKMIKQGRKGKSRFMLMSEQMFEQVQDPNFISKMMKNETLPIQMYSCESDIYPFIIAPMMLDDILKEMPMNETFIKNVQIQECIYCQKYIPLMREAGKVTEFKLPESIQALLAKKANDAVYNFMKAEGQI